MKRILLCMWLAALPAFGQFGNATRLQSRPLAATAPSNTNVICWDSTATTWKPCAASSGGTPGSPVNSVQFNSAGSLGGVPNSVAATATHLSVLPSGVVFGQSPRIVAKGLDGFPRIFVAGHQTTAYYVRCTNTDCSTNVQTVFTAATSTINVAAIRVGTDGFARILYTDTDLDLHFVICADDDCTVNTDTVIATGDPTTVTFYLDTGNIAVIAYNEFVVTPNPLKFIRCANAACTGSPTTASLSLGADSYYVDISKAPSGRPVILVAVGTATRLLFSSDANFGSLTNTLLTSSSAGGGQLEFASDNFARVSGVISPTRVWFFKCLDATCSTSTATDVVAGSTVAPFALLAGDLPAFVAQDPTSSDSLTYYVCSDQACATPPTATAIIFAYSNVATGMYLVSSTPHVVTLPSFLGYVTYWNGAAQQPAFTNGAYGQLQIADGNGRALSPGLALSPGPAFMDSALTLFSVGIHGNNGDSCTPTSNCAMQLSDGTGTSGHFAKFDGNGNVTNGDAVGFSGTCTIAGLTNIIVVNGLITACN